MADDFLYDVFLSHNAKDKPRVRRLAERLRDAGLRVWFDDWSVKAGEIISLKVDEGLEQSRVLLLCMSPNALASGWVALERSTAVHRDPSNAQRRFIPLLLADCDLPDTLRRYKYVDLREESGSAFEELLAACRIERIDTAPVLGADQRTRSKSRAEQKDVPKQKTPLTVLERTLKDQGWVNTVAVSPDGKLIASASDDKVKISNLMSGKSPAILSGHTGSVRCVHFMSDSHLFSGAQDDTFRLWDTERKTVLHVEQLNWWPTGAASIGQDDFIVAGLGDTALIRWNSKTKTSVWKARVYDILTMAMPINGTTFVTGHISGYIRTWNVETGETIAELKAHEQRVNSVQITADGRYVISGSDDTTIKVWDLAQLTCQGTLEGHKDKIKSIAISPDERVIASAAFQETVRLWDWKSGTCLHVLEVDQGPTCLTFTPDGARLVVGTIYGGVHVYRLSGLQPAAATEAARRYVNAKVVLLGEGTVGKTSLAHRLIDDKYVVKDRTHGMNVWPLELPLAPDTGFEREVLLWDLAGQEDYRLIHQLFLDETALALLLVNPQKDDPFAEAGDWLKALKAACEQSDAVREVTRLLIFSQTDVGGMKLGDAKIERFREQYGFADWLPTSAKTGANCSDGQNNNQPSKLKQLIARNIPWDTLPWTSTPRLLVELKKAVIAMRDERDIRLLRFGELTQRLEQALPDEKLQESDVRTAVTLLANHGLARRLKFGDLVLLQPELLNGYAGAIIRAARANKDEIGSVLEADIYDSGFDFTGVDRLKHRPDEELLLRALVQTFLDHSLCIAEDLANGRHLVFPSQYRREKDIPRDPDIFVSYTFSGEWQTVWTTLVVRLWYSQQFKHKELWRNAVEFSSPTGFTLGLKIDNRQGEGMATVSLYFDKEVPDDLKAIFIEYVHKHLARFGCEVSRDRRYLCQACGTPVKDLEAVRKRLEAKKDFITCQNCDERVILIDFIEQQLKSDPVARKILAMDELATRALDSQALEQILIGHMMATCGEANQIFRQVDRSDHGIDGEVEFKDNDGQLSGKKIYVQLKNQDSYMRRPTADGDLFEVKVDRHLQYWISQPVDVYLVLRQSDEITGSRTIRWMNVTRYLRERTDKTSRQIPFTGEKLDMEAVWKVRDQFFPKLQARKEKR